MGEAVALVLSTSEAAPQAALRSGWNAAAATPKAGLAADTGNAHAFFVFVAAVFVFVPDTGVGCNVTIVAASGIMFAYLFRRLVSLD